MASGLTRQIPWWYIYVTIHYKAAVCYQVKTGDIVNTRT